MYPVVEVRLKVILGPVFTLLFVLCETVGKRWFRSTRLRKVRFITETRIGSSVTKIIERIFTRSFKFSFSLVIFGSVVYYFILANRGKRRQSFIILGYLTSGTSKLLFNHLRLPLRSLQQIEEFLHRSPSLNTPTQ